MIQPVKSTATAQALIDRSIPFKKIERIFGLPGEEETKSPCKKNEHNKSDRESEDRYNILR